jgi:hypothetical protein
MSSVGFAEDKAVPVPYPKGYRNWTHIKSMVIYDKKHPLYGAFGGIHHIYANPAATKAIKTKKPFPDGSVIVFDLLENTEASGAYSEGKRKFVGVMYRDAKKYAFSEGWGWQVFEGNGQTPSLKTAGEQKACSVCHLEVKANSFVFTEWRQ